MIDRYLEKIRLPAPSLLRSWFDKKARKKRAGFLGQRINHSLVYRVKHDLLLAKPLTYMNRSGIAVKEVYDRFHLSKEDCLIIYDDFDLKLGQLRARSKGGAGGHKGMASIIEQVESEEIPRLRIGIGDKWTGELTEYVLSEFSEGEQEIVDRVLHRAAEAIDCFYQCGIEKVMDSFNIQLSSLP